METAGLSGDGNTLKHKAKKHKIKEAVMAAKTSPTVKSGEAGMVTIKF